MNDKRVVGYARVSTESQIDNTSIGLQVEKINDYAKLHDLIVDHIFIDEGLSGSKEDRPEYMAMMEYINTNDEVHSIIVMKADRVHRSARNLLNMIYELNEREVSLVSITESFINTETSQGRLFITMMGGFSEFERDMINERTQSGRIKKAKTKKYAGGRVPYGYDLLDSDTLSINECESVVVKKVYELRKECRSLQRIADTLNNEGIKNKNGKSWSKQAIDYMIKNKVYTGEYEYNGDKEQNNILFKIPKIVSKQLWNKVNNK